MSARWPIQDRPGDPNHLPLAAPPPTESLKAPSLAVSPLAMRSPQQQTPKLTTDPRRGSSMPPELRSRRRS